MPPAWLGSFHSWERSDEHHSPSGSRNPRWEPGGFGPPCGLAKYAGAVPLGEEARVMEMVLEHDRINTG